MKIFIPSYNRHQGKRAGTIINWHRGIEANVVVRPEEEQAYRDLIHGLGLGADLRVLPIGEVGIARTREAIMNYAHDQEEKKAIMVDDDLGFLVRRDDHAWKLRGQELEDTQAMFGWMSNQLNTHAHCAISMREGNNRVLEYAKAPGRGIRVVGYRTDILVHRDVHFRPELEGREDLDMTLQLLRLGYQNPVCYHYAQGQRGSNTAGGLEGTDARKAEAMEASAKLLAAEHPGFVKAVQKETKSAWGGGLRWDVRIQWKKAWESSQ